VSYSGATVLLSNHTEFGNASVKTRMMASRGFGPNPFVNGAESVKNYYVVTSNCAVAAQLALEKTAAGK
jgi:metallo-beta-lactamase class B